MGIIVLLATPMASALLSDTLGAWVPEHVAYAGGPAYTLRMAMGAGKVYVLYTTVHVDRPPSTDAHYPTLATRDSSGWSFQELPSTNMDARENGGIQVDAAGNAHFVIVQQGGTRDAEYRVGQGTTWTAETLPGDWTFVSDLILDPDGRPHILGQGGGALKVATRLGPGSWDVKVLRTTGWDCTATMSMGPSGLMRVVHNDCSTGGTRYYVEGPTGAWADDSSGMPLCFEGALAIDQNDQPHLACAENSGLRYYSRADGIWTLRYDRSGDFNIARIQLDAQGLPHILGLRSSVFSTGGVYIGPVAGGKNAVFTGLAEDEVSRLDGGLRNGDMVLDATGKPVLAVYDRTPPCVDALGCTPDNPSELRLLSAAVRVGKLT